MHFVFNNYFSCFNQVNYKSTANAESPNWDVLFVYLPNPLHIFVPFFLWVFVWFPREEILSPHSLSSVPSCAWEPSQFHLMMVLPFAVLPLAILSPQGHALTPSLPLLFIWSMENLLFFFVIVFSPCKVWKTWTSSFVEPTKVFGADVLFLVFAAAPAGVLLHLQALCGYCNWSWESRFSHVLLYGGGHHRSSDRSGLKWDGT